MFLDDQQYAVMSQGKDKVWEFPDLRRRMQEQKLVRVFKTSANIP